MMSERCGSSISGGGYRIHQCSRAGTVERDGGRWCKTHDPERVAARQAERESRYKAKCESQDAITQEGEGLARRLGFGQVYYDALGPYSRCGYRRALIIAFEDIESLLKALGR